MSKAPLYGEEPPLQGYRRSLTIPHRQLSIHEKAGLDSSDADSGLLYQHSSVRIFSFAPPTEAIISKSSERHTDADYPIDTIETLPWRSRTEDLTASGPMKIEKIKGSVNFLKCGRNFMHSMLRNSQCWCVDGESKFVLRKGHLQYYRIELPNTTEEEKAKVEELKTALATILRFEKTPCPFKRAFHVDLPDDAITPRRKGKWTRRDSGLISSPDTEMPPQRKWKSSRPPTSYNGPPTAFPGAFNKRRASDYVTDMSIPMPMRPVQLERRSSVAERRAAFENLQSPSQPSSRPRTPASVVSSEDMNLEDYDQSEPESAIRRTGGSPHASLRSTPSPSNVTSSKRHTIGHNVPQFDEKETLPVSSETVDERRGSTCDPISKQAEVKNYDSPRRQSIESNTAASSSRQQSVERNPTPSSSRQTSASLGMANDAQPELSESVAETESSQKPASPIVNAVAETESSQKPGSPIVDAVAEPESATSEQMDNDSKKPGQEDQPKSTQFLDIPMPSLRPMGSVDTLYTRLLREVSTEAVPKDEMSDTQDDTESIVSTADSFHTVDTINEETHLNDTDPTPMAESFDPLGAKQYSHKRDISEVTVTASTFSGSQEQPDGDRPGTPRLVNSTASDDSWPDVLTPSNDIQDGLRQRLKSRRSLSPLPPSDTVVRSAPPQPSSQLATAIIQKAATIVVVKPIEAVALVVHVLARIAGGATLNDLLSGGLFQRPQQPSRHARNPSFPDYIGRDHDEEDDFGVPIRGRARGSESRAPNPEVATTKKAERDTDVDSLFADDLD